MTPSPLAAVDVAQLLQRNSAATAARLQAEQVQLHGQNVPWAVAGALVLTLLFVGVQWQALPAPLLLAWAGALLAVMAWRGVLWHWQRRGGQPRGGNAGWLRLYRANFAAHGLVWAAASALPLPPDQPLQLALLMMMLAGVCAANFVLNAFDLAAALLFGVPAMGALALRLLLSGSGVQALTGLGVLLALGFFALIGRRAYRLVRENTLLRLAETRQNHLLRVLIESTSEGFWFIDNQARTVDANPAMCQMLGLPREALLGRSIYDFVDAENRAVFVHQIALRAAGATGGYEITLQRPDGSRLDCFNQATPLVDDTGQRVGSVGMWIDISERKRTEHALREAGEALRQKGQALEDTLASIDQGIVHYDGQGLLRNHNRRLLELLELPASLMQPGVSRQVVSGYLSDRGDLRDGQQLLDPTGQPLPLPASTEQLPDLYVRAAPSGLLLEVRTRHLADGGMVRTFSDVTNYIQALRSLAAREREQRDLLAAFPGFILVIDHGLHYTYVNQRFADLLGMPASSIIGRPAPEVLGAERFARVRAALAQARQHGPVTVESDYPATAWRPRVVLQVTHAVSQDPATGQERVFAFGIDISARKAAEAALVAARDEAERANRAKSQFLSSMSHELRTPLNAILGFGHLLATDTRHPLLPGQKRQMDEILRGGRHLLHLINEVLDLAVVESGGLRVQLQPVALAPVLAEVLALLQPLAGSRGVQLPVAGTGLVPGACVQADPVRLKQVLLNLLGNAIKYNRPQGQVWVQCSLGPAAADGAGQDTGSAVQSTDSADQAASGLGHWRITVQDTGAGLSPAQQARLFSAFDRVGADTAAVEGTGLGLALSRGLVRAMGGQIGVHSTPGTGSSFWFALPAAPAGSAPAPVAAGAGGDAPVAAGAGGDAPVAAGASGDKPAQVDAHAAAATSTTWPPALPADTTAQQRPQVLYVDDNAVNRLVMEAVFENLPGLALCQATTAAEGLQMALQMAQQAPPRLMLVDIQLPDMDGLQLLQLLRQHAPLQQVPVIAVSADATPEVIAQCRAAGFADYLTKPLDLDRLHQVLLAALRAG